MSNPAFYAYQQVVAVVAPHAYGMSIFWYKLADNVIFELELAFIIAYALLRRRATADKVKWRNDVDNWFESAGDMRRGVRKMFGKKGPNDKTK